MSKLVGEADRGGSTRGRGGEDGKEQSRLHSWWEEGVNRRRSS